MSRPKETNNCPQGNLFLTPIKNFIKENHELKILAEKLDWEKITDLCAPYYSEIGRKGISVRLMVGLSILQYIHNLSEDRLCKMWLENPYWQYFCGEYNFQHEMPIDRSSLSRWRKRIGDEKLEEILQISLSTAYEFGALESSASCKVIVDTTVQEKMCRYPSEIQVVYDGILDLGKLAKKEGLKLKENFRLSAKKIFLKASGYLRAKQMNRFRRSLKKLKWMLLKLTKRIENARNSAGLEELSSRFEDKLLQGKKVFYQNKDTAARSRIYSWHHPEVECIAKGKSRSPYEFGCKVSLATNLKRSPGGHFILGSLAFHGNPFDGHTLKRQMDQLERISGSKANRIYVDRGYKGHDYEDKKAVFKSGQRRCVTSNIKKELRSRSLIEPIIGHAKHDHRMAKCRLKGVLGDKINAIWSAIGFKLCP